MPPTEALTRLSPRLLHRLPAATVLQPSLADQRSYGTRRSRPHLQQYLYHVLDISQYIARKTRRQKGKAPKEDKEKVISRCRLQIKGLSLM